MLSLINVSQTDQKIRYVLAIVFLVIAIYSWGNIALAIIMIVLAAIMIVTGFKRSCPIYQGLKLSTAKGE